MSRICRQLFGTSRVHNACLTFKSVHLQTPHHSISRYQPLQNLRFQSSLFSHIYMYLPALFQPRVLSVTHPRPFEIPFLLLSSHSLPSPLVKLLLKPTISNWPVVPNVSHRL